MAEKSTYDKVDTVLEVLESTGLYLRDEIQREEWDRTVRRLRHSLIENTGREGSMSGNTGEEKGGIFSKRMIPVYVAHGILVVWAIGVGLAAWFVWGVLSSRVPESDSEVRAVILTAILAGGFLMAKHSVAAIRGLLTQMFVSRLVRPGMQWLPGIGFAAWTQMANALGVSAYSFDAKKSGEEEQLKRLADSLDYMRHQFDGQSARHGFPYDDPSYWTRLDRNGQSFWVHVPGTPADVHIPYVRYFPIGRSTGASWICSCGYGGDYPSPFEDLRQHLEQNGFEFNVNRDHGLTWTQRD